MRRLLFISFCDLRIRFKDWLMYFSFSLLRGKEKEKYLVTIGEKAKEWTIVASCVAILHKKQVFGKRRQRKRNTRTVCQSVGALPQTPFYIITPFS